ncbi:hypothetical protein [Aeromicrobium duanguangcaii]|uniref:DNA helicase n=1 Tax=Aeromicrobium duanguangcaii TaxID=2968086 RepID=A0ABY5KHF2_9ACTN|nr:hypothetical protein [Aeromicrobium duanguangcaii]MCD9153129.1 hypothetical protein [Aeromicrobium duanguangcaii]UUI69770.1 hypothetical protein NP095_06665 [Aeromicrobium duanguangcaii]
MGAGDGDRQDSLFWGETLPEQMGEFAEGLADNLKCDAVIVDEAQDFADSWWQPVLKSLRDEGMSGLYIYSDENQRIFARFGCHRCNSFRWFSLDWRGCAGSGR